jgi:hypothetical protein
LLCLTHHTSEPRSDAAFRSMHILRVPIPATAKSAVAGDQLAQDFACGLPLRSRPQCARSFAALRISAPGSRLRSRPQCARSFAALRISAPGSRLRLTPGKRLNFQMRA